MAKILSIGLSGFSNKDVEIRSTIDNLPSLFDYDVVIVNPNHVVPYEYNYEPWKSIEIDFKLGNDYAGNLERMKKDSAMLLQKGGIIICLITPMMETKFYNQFHTQISSNYDWVPIKDERRGNIIERGSGKGFKDIKKSDFKKYIKSDSEWYGYFVNFNNFTADNDVLDIFGFDEGEFIFEHEVLAKNDGGKPVAISFRAGNGQFVFLPWSHHEKMADILLQCSIQSQHQEKEKEPPNWLSNYLLPDELDLMKSIKKSKNELLKITEKVDTIQDEFDEKIALKKLLYEQSTPLENTVKLAFEELGISMQKKGSKDWIATINEQEIIIEVTGQNSSIDVTKLSQLIRYKLEEEEESKEKKLAILVGNHFADTEPDKRKEPFTQETIDRAKPLSIGLLSTLELYNTMIKLRSRKISNKEICEKLLSGSGVLELV